MNPWKDETNVVYRNKEVPYIRISIMNNDTLIYRFALEDLNYYYNNHGCSHSEDCIEIHTPVINPKDYSVLVSQHYDKYVLDIQQIWRSAETGKDELIESMKREDRTKDALIVQLNARIADLERQLTMADIAKYPFTHSQADHDDLQQQPQV